MFKISIIFVRKILTKKKGDCNENSHSNPGKGR